MQLSKATGYLQIRARSLANGARVQDEKQVDHQQRRAAAGMSLVHSARLNGHDLYAYLRDVLERLPKHPACRVAELLPHHWRPAA